jgi:hypothetical protein
MLADRAEARADASMNELVRRVRQRFANDAARVVIVCPATLTCSASIDGREADATRRSWTTAGKHVVVVSAKGGASVEKEIRLAPGEAVTIAPTDKELAPPEPRVDVPAVVDPMPSMSPAMPPPTAAAHSDGLPIWWLASAATATGLAVATATYFTFEAKGLHDDLVDNPSAATAREGESAQTNARIAWAIAGGFAATTIVLALFTDLGSSRRNVRVGLGPTGIAVGGTLP